jgi:3-deoxy-D-manno-octulosonic-acid transferase
MSIFYFLYSAVTGAGILLLSPYFLYKGLRERKYLQNLPERMGWKFPPELKSNNNLQSTAWPGAIWLHAVSVGEVLAALPLARALKERFPEHRLVISTTTATGQALARERMSFVDAVFYFPLDWSGPMRRAMRAVRPEVAIVCETEIWPNFLREARRAGVPVVFVNGRISDHSFARWQRTMAVGGGLVRGFLRQVLSDAQLFLTQSETDSERLIELGAERKRVIVTGNMKYDMPPPAANALVTWLAAQESRSRRQPLLVAGSVSAGEEAAVLEALAVVEKQWPQTLLVLAPRKPERFHEAARLIEDAGWRVVRRSKIALIDDSSPLLEYAVDRRRSVLLLDSVGELAAVYRLADAVFIGGSLVRSGGHNPLEPAAVGKAPVFGASMENFREIAAELLLANGAIEVLNGAELGAAWAAQLSDPSRAAVMGTAAREVVLRHRGATTATLDHVASFLAGQQAHAAGSSAGMSASPPTGTKVRR